MGSIFSYLQKTPSCEHQNFTRFGQALVGTGTKILQEVLETYLPSKDIAAKVTHASHPNLWNRLNQQQKLLIGRAVTDGYKGFDITLCYTLLRNINVNVRKPFQRPFPQPTQGWGNTPQPTDLTQSDDIERIRFLRNEMYGHLAHSLIPNTQFKEVWGQLKDVCIRMKVKYPNATDYLKEISNLENCQLTRFQWNTIVDIVEQNRDHDKAIDDHAKRLDSLQAQQNVMNQHLQTANDRIDTLQNDGRAQHAEIETLGIGIQGHSAQIDEHTRDLTSLNTEVHTQRTMVNEHAIHLDRLNSKSNRHSRQIEDHNRQLHTLTSSYQRQETEVVNIKTRLENAQTESATDEEVDVNRLKKRLKQINDDFTKVITISPLQERIEDGLPIELLFAQVVILQDNKYKAMGEQSTENRKEITDPDDIFKKDGENVRKIYMVGDAARGKTTYCLWLVKNWCNAQSEDIKKNTKWEIALGEFDFVFLVQFRYVNPCRAYIVDMICQDLFGSDKDCRNIIRFVLSSDKYRSLIIMDGLDEWNPSKKSRKRLTCQGIPNIEGISSSVTCFISMRPCVISRISKLVKISDMVTEIFGLSDTGMESVIKNVLLNYYNLKEDVAKFTSTFQKIENHLQRKNLRSFMQIPLLAVVCVQIWYEENQIEDSMTSFYAKMLNMIIERANERHAFQIEQCKSSICDISEVFPKNEHIEKYFSILLKLGKLAYEGLLSNEPNLIFRKTELENEIGMKEIQFLLNVGLISQKEEHSILTKNVSVQFFHKSVQEFMAAVYLVSTKEVHESFCDRLSNVSVIMNLSNVILFVYGLCPSMCNTISQCVVSATDNDTEICEYRELPGINNQVKQLYSLQLDWYRELRYKQTASQVTFHVSDVHFMYSGLEILTITKELLSDDNACIRSLYLWCVPTGEKRGVHGIRSSDLNKFLASSHKTKSLAMMSIMGDHDGRYINPICIPSLRILYLQELEIRDIESGDNVYPPLLTDMKLLKILVLRNVNMGEKILGLSADMTLLEKIEFFRVTMTAAAWKQFVISIKNLHNTFEVALISTNIDDESKRQIRSFFDFTIKEKVKRDGSLKARQVPKRDLYFTRVWQIQDDHNNDEILYSRT